jgi:WD40 repeat protein
MEEIRRAIDGCERFLCVVSRHSAVSKVCIEEIAHAEHRGKSFVPVILQEIDPAGLPAALQKPQWIRCLDEDEFPRTVQDVITALETNHELVREQRRLLELSLDWQRLDHRQSLLLRGEALAGALDWKNAASCTIHPLVTADHEKFIAASIEHERDMRIRANSLRLASLGMHQIERAPDLALLLAAEAYDIAPTDEARTALLSTLDYQSRLLTWIKAPGSYIVAVAYNPSGTLLATGLNDGRVLLWDGMSHKQVDALPEKHTDGISCLAFSPDGSQLATGGYDKSVILWDLNSRCVQRKFSEVSWVESLAFSPSGNMLAIGSSHVTVMALDRRSGDRLYFSTSNASITDLVFTPDEETILIASLARLMRGSLVSKTDEIEVLPFAPNGCISLALSPDGSLLALGLPDATVVLWDMTKDTQRETPFYADGGGALCLAFSPDGEHLSAGTPRSKVLQWDLNYPTKEPEIFRAQGDRIVSVAYHPGGKELASCGHKGAAAVWGATSRHRIAHQPYEPEMYGSIAAHAESRVLARGTGKGEIFLHDLHSGEELQGRLTGLSGIIEGISFSADGSRLAAIAFRTAMIWDIAGRTPLGEGITIEDIVEGVNLSPDGGTIALRTAMGKLTLWDVATQKPREHFEGRPFTQVTAMGYSPDGHWLAVGEAGDRITFWDPESGEMVEREIGKDRDIICHVAFDPQGIRLIVATRDGRISVYPTPGSAVTPLEILGGHEEGEVCTHCIPGTNLIASGGEDGVLVIWDITTGIPLGRPLTAGQDPIDSIVSTADGKQLVTGPDMTYWTIDPSDWVVMARKVANRGLTDNERARYIGEGDSTEIG